MTPNSIAAQLRRLGFNPASPSDPNREGLKVKGNYSKHEVLVVADFDSEVVGHRMSIEAEDALAANGRGTRRTSPTIFYVTETVGTFPCARCGMAVLEGLRPLDPEAPAVCEFCEETPMTRP